MSKNKYKYYLCYIDSQNLDFIESEEQYTLQDLYDFSIHFLNDIPDIYGTTSFTDKLIKSSLNYNKLGDLIDDYIFNVDEDDLSEMIENAEKLGDEDPTLSRFETLLDNDFIIFRNDIKTNKFELVDIDTIINTYNNMFNSSNDEIDLNEYDNILTNDIISTNKILNFDDNFDEFINLIESKIESTTAHFTMSYDHPKYKNSSYDICIMKKDSNIHKKFLKEIKNVELSSSENGFIYENTFLNLKLLIYSLIEKNVIIGATFSVPTSDISLYKKSGKNTFFKKYGFLLRNENNKFTYTQLNANDVYISYVTNSKPDKYEIYCGVKDDDIICGFDKM